jgi:DNA-binding MarR family transcriptional regulator
VVEIGRNPGICVKDLAKELKLDKSAVSRTVEELVQKGYVIRKPSQTDRRSVVLTLTEVGQAHYRTIENDMNEKFRKVFSRIPKDKQEQVLEALRLYNEACEKEEGDCCD